jgi:5-bromo-4-chloroindolyl phosphate hydrolysis protein
LAFLGPASSVAQGGNIAQSAVSSAVSYGVKKQTGMTPSEHAIAYVQKHNPENKKEKCLEFIDLTNSEACAAVKENISKTKKKIVKVKKSIFDKSKIEDLAKKSGIVSR